MGEVRSLRPQTFEEKTPLQLAKQAHDLGEGSTELGLRRLLQVLLDRQVPQDVRVLWGQIAAVDAGISVMLTELMAILERVDPDVSNYTD